RALIGRLLALVLALASDLIEQPAQSIAFATAAVGARDDVVQLGLGEARDHLLADVAGVHLRLGGRALHRDRDAVGEDLDDRVLGLAIRNEFANQLRRQRDF